MKIPSGMSRSIHFLLLCCYSYRLCFYVSMVTANLIISFISIFVVNLVSNCFVLLILNFILTIIIIIFVIIISSVSLIPILTHYRYFNFSLLSSVCLYR